MFRKLIVLWLALAIGSAAHAQTSESERPYWPDEPVVIDSALLSRAGITVRDIDEALSLYRDILCMEVVVDRPRMADPRMPVFLGMQHDQHFRFVILRLKTAGPSHLNAGYLSLAEIRNADGSRYDHPDTAPVTGSEPGSMMLMFIVEDIHKVYAQVQEMGLAILSPPTRRPDGTSSEMLMRGPNGERLWVTDRYGRSAVTPKRQDPQNGD